MVDIQRICDFFLKGIIWARLIFFSYNIVIILL